MSHATRPSRSPAASVTPPSLFADAWAERLEHAESARPLDALGLGVEGRVLAVLAHPDDETLAMGGTLASIARAGVDVQVLVLSRGEAALDHVGVHVPGLADRRDGELSEACSALGVRRLRTRTWPDGGLCDAVPEATTEVARLLDDLHPDVVLTLWRGEPHPDHVAAGTIATRAAGGRTRVVEMMLWAVHWTDPLLVEADVRRMDVRAPARRAKALALSSYVSQTRPLADGLYPILPFSVVNWPHECMVES